MTCTPSTLEPFPLFVDMTPPRKAFWRRLFTSASTPGPREQQLKEWPFQYQTQYTPSPTAELVSPPVPILSKGSLSYSEVTTITTAPYVDKKPVVSPLIKFQNSLALRYYQYEVTFGLYMLTPREKIILNTLLVGVSMVLSYALLFSLQPALVRLICRILWYLTGAHDGVEDVCGDVGAGC